MTLAPAPEFWEIDPNSGAFRVALNAANDAMEGIETIFNVYSRHKHEDIGVVVGNKQILFEQQLTDGELKLFPLDLAEAATRGKPSCWAFSIGENSGTEIHVLRYADHMLHEQSGIDVESTAFQTDLRQVADAFVTANLQEILEVNVASYLFPTPAGILTRERTLAEGYHLVDFIPMTPEIEAGDWNSAACWGFGERKPTVTGICWTEGDSNDPKHRENKD